MTQLTMFDKKEQAETPAPTQRREKVSPAHTRKALPLVCPVCGTEAIIEFEGTLCGVCGGTFERR